LHNSAKDSCKEPESVDLRHSFPDFENSVHRHADGPEREQDLFRRVDFAGGNPFVAGGLGDDFHGADGPPVDSRQQAYDAGYQEGLAAGRQAAEARLELLAGRLQKALDDINKLSGEVYSVAEAQAVELSLMVARKIIGREAAVDRGVVVHAVRRALEGLARGAEVTVVLNPDDIAFLRTLSPGELSGTDDKPGRIDFQADPAMVPGGCLVKTVAGDRDASIDGQMDRIADVFEEVLQQRAQANATAEGPDDG
jgi:flagellar assembly protein FliH